jgi:hypothetical protein
MIQKARRPKYRPRGTACAGYRRNLISCDNLCRSLGDRYSDRTMEALSTRLFSAPQHRHRASLLVLGGCFFWLRSKHQIFYGLIELGAAILTAIEAVQRFHADDEFHFALVMMASIYIVVRAFDDISKGRQQAQPRSGNGKIARKPGKTCF